MDTTKNKPLKNKPIRLQVYFASSDDSAYKDIVRIAEATGNSLSEVAMHSIMVGILSIGDVLLENQSNLNKAVASAVRKQQKRKGQKDASIK